MFRVLLTAYMSLVMLAGPSACCCTTARAVSGCFTDGAVEVPVEVSSCCRGHHAPRDDAGMESTVDGNESDGTSAPGEEHECPCQKNRSHAVADAREQVVDLQLVRSIVPSPLDAASLIMADVKLTVVGANAQIPNHASHFNSATELLRALRTYLI